MKEEFDRQVGNLAGRAKLAGLTEDEFLRYAGPLADRLPTDGDVPFVLVLTGVPGAEAMPLTEPGGRPGFTTMEPDDLARFVPTVEVPGRVYLLADVDPGAGFLDVPPADALPAIAARGRSPLTIDEGIALVTHFPDLLDTHRFSLLGSRCGDRRVPAIWVSEKRPRLGWCWDGAPHSWLGSASCASRIGE